MSRTLILFSFLMILPIFNLNAKSKPPLTLQINPSTTKTTDPNEPVTLSAVIISEIDFDTLTVDWKFEGQVEFVSGDKSTVLTDVKAGSTTNAQIVVKFLKLEGAKVILSVHKEVTGGHFGQSQIYVPALASKPGNKNGPKDKSTNPGKQRRIYY